MLLSSALELEHPTLAIRVCFSGGRGFASQRAGPNRGHKPDGVTMLVLLRVDHLEAAASIIFGPGEAIMLCD